MQTMSDREGESRELVDAAIARARQAQAGWSLLSFRERGRALRRLAAWARDDAELACIISEETGKPLFEAIGEARARVKIGRSTGFEASTDAFLSTMLLLGLSL